MEKKVLNSGVSELATIVGAFLFTKDNMMVQSKTKLIRFVAETLVIEFDP